MLPIIREALLFLNYSIGRYCCGFRVTIWNGDSTAENGVFTFQINDTGTLAIGTAGAPGSSHSNNTSSNSKSSNAPQTGSAGVSDEGSLRRRPSDLTA